MALAHQIAFSEKKRRKKTVLNDAVTPASGDGVALTSIEHPKGRRVRKRPIAKAATEKLVAKVTDGKITAIEKALVLRLDITLVTKIDATKTARGLKSRSEMIRVLLSEALAK